MPPPNQVFQTGIWSPTQPSRVPMIIAKASAPTILVSIQSLAAITIISTLNIRYIHRGNPRIFVSFNVFTVNPPKE